MPDEGAPSCGATLILAPVGTDGRTIAYIAERMSVAARICRDQAELAEGIGEDTALLVMTEEALAGGLDPLREKLAAQPAWSDLPVLLLARGGRERGGEARWRLIEQLGHVTILDRPLHVGALESAIRAALRSRSRQLHSRDLLRQLDEARAILEIRVEERTRALAAEVAERRQAEAALAQARRLESIGQLTGGVAHDFNNLLQIVLGGLAALERHGLQSERGRALLEGMRQSAERGAKLTQQLLAFARRQTLAPEPADPRAVIERMRELLQGAVRADLRLDLRLPDSAWTVEIDVTQFEVALLNLVVNARDATASGGSVSVALENIVIPAHRPIDGLSGEFVRVAVSDTGTGMEEEVMRRALEPFFTTKDLGRGTGLGLSQVYGFAKQSGGGLRIDSAPGAGTTVSILLPRGDGSPAASPTDPEAEARGSGRILVVEDDPLVAELACQMVTDLGYRCEHAANADEALQAELEGFDAVFSDVLMPGGMDGISLAAELRKAHPSLPILLTSGFAGAPERIQESGFPILPKPYTMEELSRALRDLFGTRH